MQKMCMVAQEGQVSGSWLSTLCISWPHGVLGLHTPDSVRRKEMERGSLQMASFYPRGAFLMTSSCLIG